MVRLARPKGALLLRGVPVLLVVLGVLAAPPVQARTVTIGVVFDKPWTRNAEIRESLQREIHALLDGDFDVRFPSSAERVADKTLDGAATALDELLADPAVDVVIAAGPLSSHAVCCRENLPKPVIAGFVIDQKLQQFPREGVGSGRRNLSYVAMQNHFALGLKALKELLPVKRVTVLFESHLSEAIPGLAERIAGTARALDIEADRVPATDSVLDVLSAIPANTEAVYLMPLLHFTPEQMRELADGLRSRNLSSFAALDQGEVDAGIMAGLRQEELLVKLSRRVALNLHRILLGEEAAKVPVDFVNRSRLVINLGTARWVDAPIGVGTFLTAQLVGRERPTVRRITFEQSVTRALEANLELKEKARDVEAGLQDIARARAELLPQLDTSITALAIDEDRAAASLGSQPERSVSGTLGLEQLVYADGAFANLTIQRHLHRGREAELEQLRLDVAEDAARAYLDVLRARTLERIQRENMELTREHLSLAEVRRAVGEASNAEIYRWDAELAADTQALVDAIVNRQIAEIVLNRLLHRPQEEAFDTEEVSLNDPDFLIGQPRFQRWISPRRYEIFRDFVVRDGLERAPELDQLRAAIDARERQVLAARRRFWTPQVGLRAALEHQFSESGAGTTGLMLPPALGVSVPEADDTGWSVALNLRFPLFTGGSRRAERIQAEGELAALQARYDAVAEKLEQRIRINLHAIRSSYSNIQLSAQAAGAADKNLELVEDAYAQGVVTIIELLDAQNAALVARQVSASAVYDFYKDLIAIERSIHRLDFFVSPPERKAWFDALDAYYQERNLNP